MKSIYHIMETFSRSDMNVVSFVTDNNVFELGAGKTKSLWK